ncbi:MAG: MBL fold metallo-hydrolase [Anaerolineales bacterium]|nr:MBL fold metallo-hydrolase [Anaerolineales bacterium]
MHNLTHPIRIEMPTGLTVGPVNAYLFTAPEPILVDCGIRLDAAWTALEDGLAKNGLSVADLSRVIITHPHVDHYGLAGRIAAESDAEIWISDVGASWLLSSAEMWQQRFVFYREHFLAHLGLPESTIDDMSAGMQEMATKFYEISPASVVTFHLEGVLQLGGMSWQVIHVPGHTYRQTCFYQPETRQLLSADHLLAVTPTPVVERTDHGHERIPGLPQFLQSLDLVEQLEVDQVYPGHGRPFTNHRDVIKRQRERIVKRKAECLDLVKQGHDMIPALLDIMYAHYPPQFRAAGLWMLVGYLDLLQADGLIVEETIDNIWHYCLVH